MSKKYYLLTMILVGGMIAYSHVDAKSTNSHVISKSANAPQKQPSTNNDGETNTQDEPVSRPQISRILFTGNTKISSDVLQKAIPLKVQQIADENVIMNSMVKIAQLYKAKNIKVTITPVLEKTQTHTINIRFDVHEMQMDKK